MQQITKFFQSKLFQGIIIGMAIFLAFLLIFKAGMMVGSRKAEFSGNWSENYHLNFAGPKEGFLNEFEGKDFMEANGVFGQIIKVEGSSIVVKGKDDVEKSIIIEDGTTTIKRLKDTLKISDLKTNDLIVIIGEPNGTGQMQARLIRVMPPAPQKDPKAGPRIMPY
ncbi:MAG: hypothetical protein WCX77_02070 [Candidatus Paceibacterota bacterium]|jgi:hypothetical protein